MTANHAFQLTSLSPLRAVKSAVKVGVSHLR